MCQTLDGYVAHWLRTFLFQSVVNFCCRIRLNRFAGKRFVVIAVEDIFFGRDSIKGLVDFFQAASSSLFIQYRSPWSSSVFNWAYSWVWSMGIFETKISRYNLWFVNKYTTNLLKNSCESRIKLLKNNYILFDSLMWCNQFILVN